MMKHPSRPVFRFLGCSLNQCVIKASGSGGLGVQRTGTGVIWVQGLGSRFNAGHTTGIGTIRFIGFGCIGLAYLCGATSVPVSLSMVCATLFFF